MNKLLRNKFGTTFLALVIIIAIGRGFAIPASTEAADSHTHGQAIGTLEELKALYASGGSGYLTADIAYDEELTIPSGVDVTLCFNGHLLIQSERTVNKGTLTLEDCNTTYRHYFTEDEHGVWYYNGDAEVTDYYITGGGITTAGDVTIDNYHGGGAIYLDAYAGLTIHGGNLVGNRISDTAGGGAIYTKSNSQLFMDGGLIAHNSAGYSGGGIYVESSTITVVGGEISHNYAAFYGGGVFLNDTYTRAFIILGGSTRIVENHEGDERKLDNLSNVYTHYRGINLSDAYPATAQMQIGVSVCKDYFYDYSPYSAVVQYEDSNGTLTGTRTVTADDMAYFTSDSDYCYLVYDETDKKIVEEYAVKVTGTPEAANDYAFLTESEIQDYEDDLSCKWYRYEMVHEAATSDYFNLPYSDGGKYDNGILTSATEANSYDGKYYAVFQFWSLDQIYLTFENGLPDGLDDSLYTVSDEYTNTICLTEAGYEYWLGADEPFTCKVYMDAEEPFLAEDQTGLMLMDATAGEKFYGVLYYKDYGVVYPYYDYIELEQDSLKSVKLTVTAQSVYDSDASIAYVIPENSYGNFKLFYKVDGAWTTTVPTAVGTYDVKIKRDRDTTYATYFKILKDGFTIKATPVTGVSLNKSTATLTEGDTLKLSATVAPANATDQKVTYSSSDESVATVDETGTVTAIKAGQVVITVTTADGSFTATCTVTVNKQADADNKSNNNTDNNSNSDDGDTEDVFAGEDFPIILYSLLLCGILALGIEIRFVIFARRRD